MRELSTSLCRRIMRRLEVLQDFHGYHTGVCLPDHPVIAALPIADR